MLALRSFGALLPRSPLLKSAPRPEQDVPPVTSPWAHLECFDRKAEDLLQGDAAGRNVCPFEIVTANLRRIPEMDVGIRKSARSRRVPLEGDDLSAVRLLQRVVICGDLRLPRAALSLGPHYSVVLAQSGSEGGSARTWERERFAAGDDPSMLRRRTVVAARRDLGVSDARQCELERPEEVLDCLPWCGASHPKGR